MTKVNEPSLTISKKLAKDFYTNQEQVKSEDFVFLHSHSAEDEDSPGGVYLLHCATGRFVSFSVPYNLTQVSGSSSLEENLLLEIRTRRDFLRYIVDCYHNR